MRAISLGATAFALLIGACNPAASNSSAPSDATTTTTTTGEAIVAAPARSEAPPPRGRVRIIEAAEDSDALSLVRAKRLEAKAEGRLLVVYVGATWCEPCKRLKAELASGRLDDRLAKVTFLAFDADRDGDRLGAAGYSYRFVPYVALPGADGHPADSQQAMGKGGEAWREVLDKLDAWQR